METLLIGYCVSSEVSCRNGDRMELCRCVAFPHMTSNMRTCARAPVWPFRSCSCSSSRPALPAPSTLPFRFPESRHAPCSRRPHCHSIKTADVPRPSSDFSCTAPRSERRSIRRRSRHGSAGLDGLSHDPRYEASGHWLIARVGRAETLQMYWRAARSSSCQETFFFAFVVLLKNQRHRRTAHTTRRQ